MTLAISRRTPFLKKLETYPLRSYSQKLSLYLTELYTNRLTKAISYNTLKKELYILGDFTINLYGNQNIAGCKSNTLVTATVSNDVKNYLQFCTMFGLTQVIKSPTRITYSSTSLINHILASLPEIISQEGVINVGLSNHQVIYCTREITRVETGGLHKKLDSVHLRIQ